MNIFEEALSLPDEDKLKLISILNASLGTVVPEIEKSWMEESENRLKAWENGKLKSIPYKGLKNEWK